MKTTVELSEQALNFVRSLAPEPRRSLRAGLRDLEQDRGDIKQLEGELSVWLVPTADQKLPRHFSLRDRREPTSRPLRLRRTPHRP